MGNGTARLRRHVSASYGLLILLTGNLLILTWNQIRTRRGRLTEREGAFREMCAGFGLCDSPSSDSSDEAGSQSDQ